MITFKRSAIHNLIITDHDQTHEINEGIVIPKSVMECSDIIDFEQVIVTKITGDNWINRIKTFAISGDDDRVIVRGSLTNFFEIGDVTCIISYTKLSARDTTLFRSDNFPILDVGFNPNPVYNNIKCPNVVVEYFSKKASLNFEDFQTIRNIRTNFPRVMLSNLIIGLKINNTHPDCLHGSAEIPKSIMESSGLTKFQHVLVYNVTVGGAADTYSVPMPEGVVMTTGAMAKFAKFGEVVNVSSYVETIKKNDPRIILTDGSIFLKDVSPSK